MLKIVNSTFIKSAVKKDDYPSLPYSEFAFFGRSNAGKSSLINFILNRKNLVKVSSTPGKTQSLNFFLIEGEISTKKTEEVVHSPVLQDKSSFVLVDLPGYGYAKGSKGLIKNIDSMLYEYCTNRKMLKLVFLLIDIRREELEVEKNILDFFRSIGVRGIIVATKADKIAKTKVKVAIERIKKDLGWQVDDDSGVVLSTSTLKKHGKTELLLLLESMI